MKKPVETLDFKSFLKSETIVTNEREIRKHLRKKELIKLTVRLGVVSAIILSPHIALSHGTAYAASKAVEVTATVASDPGNAWGNLISKLLELLDPIAKIFGMIGGVAIMTGNGKIGLERLFWLSLGYITTRKVDVWISFLNSI